MTLEYPPAHLSRITAFYEKVIKVKADVAAGPGLETFDVWHDRAVFHFLTVPDDRAAYRRLLAQSVSVGGHAVIGSFALDGPEKGSGLEVRRYDGPMLAVELGPQFSLLKSEPEIHVTPWGKPQSFQFSLFKRLCSPELLKHHARRSMSKSKAYLGSAIVLYFVICFEILIMISPFAGFFYSAFNPVLLGLAKYPATKWLSSFFFTHMVVPPNGPLKVVRVMGSVLFLLGIAVFFICAIQVYSHKFLKRGTVLKGLYRWIRHPQYLGLSIAGLGLAILWPRFIVVVLWLVMILVYYMLSKDEERRMLGQHPETYSGYMERTGMFLPKGLEGAIAFSTVAGKVALFVLISVGAIGGAFALRAYTVRNLPLWTDSNVTALAVQIGRASCSARG